MIQSLARHNFGGNRLKLVLNRMPKRPQIQLPELQTVMGHSIFCALPDDSQTLTEAYAESRLARFDSGFGKRMADLAATLAGIAPVAAKSRKYFWSRQEK
jgi:hypothetical protein